MHERFLQGKDYDFINYQEIDENSDYDDKKQINQDQSDKWFDDEEPLNEKEGASDTGVIDY